MATAVVRGLVFEGWWKERVVVAPGASVTLGELFADYRRECKGAGMTLKSFEDRLDGLKVRKSKRGTTRMRWGVRLRVEADGPEADEPALAMPKERAGATDAREAARLAGGVAVTGWQGQAPTAWVITAPPLYTLSPVNPGDGETVSAVMLECPSAEAIASARIAHELFGERRRQAAPEEAGGEGWTPEHDDSHEGEGNLARAAAAYAYAASQPDDCARFLELDARLERPPIRRGWAVVDFLRAVWPWATAWWKPHTERPGWRRRCLVKAGALIIAAIEKLDRADARAALTAEEQRTATGV